MKLKDNLRKRPSLYVVHSYKYDGDTSNEQEDTTEPEVFYLTCENGNILTDENNNILIL